MISELRTKARAVTPIVLDIYDKLEPLALLTQIARLVQEARGKKSFEFEWWAAFPELRRWIGDRQTQRAFQESLKGEIDPYEITLDLDKRDADSPDSLVKLQELGTSIANAFALGRLAIAWRPLKNNELAYDNQQFFDTDHSHPDESLFSNLLTQGVDTPNRADASNPTPQEVRAELRRIVARLQENTLIRQSLVPTQTASTDLTVVANSFATWSAFEDLLQEERINGDINRYRGKFNLARDHKPLPGEEDNYLVIHHPPNGPRPSIFVTAKEPSGLEFDESQLFRSRYIPFGMDGEYGSVAGFPQMACKWVTA